MKRFAVFAAVLFAVAAPGSRAQQGGMGGMDMKDKDHQGMDMSNGKKAQAKVHKGAGVVKQVDAENGTVSIAHGPIQTLGWPAMTMGFKARDKNLLKGIKPEQKVTFAFRQDKGDYVITSIK
jgi:Cu(I)/Ag(I) efflux system periplasmic protein CusF